MTDALYFSSEKSQSLILNVLVKVSSHKFFVPNKMSLKHLICTEFNPLSTMTFLAAYVTNSL